MTLPRRTIFLLVPLAILLLPVAVYLADRAASTEEIARNVTISGIPVGGLTEADAMLAVQAHEQQLRQSTGVFTVHAETFKLSPQAVGLRTANGRAVTEAMAVGRDGNPLANFLTWVKSFNTVEEIPLLIAFDDEAIEAQVDDWETAAIPNPAFEGSISVADGTVVTEYPRSGEQIDRPKANAAIRAEMSTLDKQGVVLEIVVSEPVLSRGDIDDAADLMQRMIDSEVTLTSREVGFRATFTESQLASAAVATLLGDGSIDVHFARDRVLEILEPRRGEFEIEPVDARFDIDLSTDAITVVPGRNGTLLDEDALLEEMREAALGDGIGTFPVVVGAEPDFTTEEAQSYTSLSKLASFTTDHPARQDRVINIQQMARDVDGAIVQPGDEWSINEHVGQRTEDNGYVAAPAIINGAPYCCDHPANIGGGVSQFGTTLFNTVFYACLEDVEHRPHSLSFSRYPMGLEATLGYPHPDVRFRNNTDAPVIIKTAYTDTSITVLMYGDNGGKTCTAETSEPADIVEFEEELQADEADRVVPGERIKERDGINGFYVEVTRIITHPDGSQEVEPPLTWRYRALSELYTVHACEVTGEPVNCPVELGLLVGRTWDAALSSLQELGLLAARVDRTVDDPGLDGVILDQDPIAGEWVPAGSTVTFTVGVFADGGGDG